MNELRHAAPSPEVQFLPTIFRRIESGEIRVPAFQRSFVWTEAQVLSLLESVYKGYPIGSLLFWKVETQQLSIEKDSSIPFPEVEEKYPISFVLDGMQRLATLYGSFHKVSSDNSGIFKVGFDLRNENFVNLQDKPDPGVYMELSSLFSPKVFLEEQRKLFELPDSDILIERSIKLHSRFQEYLIPTVTISERRVSEVVEIFERINSTGTILSAVDFIRALTWSSEFDLTKELSKLQMRLENKGFSFPSETLVKTMAIILERNPEPNDMLKLREYKSDQLHGAIVKTEDVLNNVIDFLKNRFRILSYDFVPYEGQILVLAKLFSLSSQPSDKQLDIASRWFWSISLSEGLRGKPADHVIRIINDITRLAKGDYNAIDHSINVNFPIFITRRFIKNKALSAAFASMFAVNNAMSLVSGEIIDYSYYMTEFSGENFKSLYPLSVIQNVLKETFTSSRVFANVIIISEQDKAFLNKMTPQEVINYVYTRFGDRAEEILASQFISKRAADMIIDDNVGGFLLERATFLELFSHSLIR